MKAILEFDLDDHHDKLTHKRAITATDAYLVLHDIDTLLRNKIKYREPQGLKYIDLRNDCYSVNQLENLRKLLKETIEDRGINMDDLE